MSFTKKTIEPTKRVCIRLKEAREASGISLRQVSDRTKIDRRYLVALEACQFDELPDAMIYQKNFIKKYLRAIGMDPKPFVAQFLMEERGGQKEAAKYHPTKKISGTRFQNIPLLVRYGVVACIVLAFLGYIASQVSNILEPPVLVVHAPENGMITDSAAIEVYGETNPEVVVTINGKEIMNNDKGEFNEMLDLSPGVNEILVVAQKKHGKITAETRYVILKETPHVTDAIRTGSL